MAESAKLLYMTVDEYLADEEQAPFRHEYIAGQVFAMTGATAAHNRICGNLYSILRGHLHGTGCTVFINDMKVRIESSSSFYYPDLMVTCEQYSAKSVFMDAPVLIVEVLSRSSKTTIAERSSLHTSKLLAYRAILSSTRTKKIEVYQRESRGHWEVIVLRHDDVLLIDSLAGRHLEIPINKIYEDCDPQPFIVAESGSYYDADDDY